jgi:predicted DNA-binding transcriptional regulator YafY
MIRNEELQEVIITFLSSSGVGTKRTVKEIVDYVSNNYLETDKIQKDSLRRRIDRLLSQQMSQYFPISCDENAKEGNSKGKREWYLVEEYDKRFTLKFSLDELQILLWAIRNLQYSSSDIFHQKTQALISSIFNIVPKEQRSYLNNAIEIFSRFYGIFKKPQSFKKNNLSKLMIAIRERKVIKARIKDDRKDYNYRHENRELGISQLTFKNNVPYIYAFDFNEKDPMLQYKSIRATRLNGIEVLDKKVPKKIIKSSTNFDYDNPENIYIKAHGHLATILKETKISKTQKNSEYRNGKIETRFKMRVSNTFINMLLPHISEIEKIKPKSLREELLLRTKRNLETFKKI